MLHRPDSWLCSIPFPPIVFLFATSFGPCWAGLLALKNLTGMGYLLHESMGPGKREGKRKM